MKLHVLLVLSSLAGMVVGCGPEDLGIDPQNSTGSALEGTLNTFVNASLEIDQAGPGPGDANFAVGADPADASASQQRPAGGPATWLDWSALGASPYDIDDHRVLDADLATGKDPTSFPQSNECVGASSVLSKMDLRYIMAATNPSYTYFGVVRSNNNGDAGYYWVFTRKAPRMNAGEAPCKPDQQRLVYDISGPDGAGSTGDVLLAGHFKPNDSPLLTVYRAKRDVTLTAIQAINYQDASVWEVRPDDVAAVAVNVTETDPGTFGTGGALAADGGILEPELFAEAAIPAHVFTGGRTCGNVFYASVITRSSGAGGTSPDLKDLAGPARFDFGSAAATATLTASCDRDVGFAATATSADGTPLPGATCSWTFSDGTTSSLCSGTVELAAGNRTGTVTITDPNSGCQASATSAEAQVCDPPTVDATLTATCNSAFGFAAVPGGGCGAGFAYAWTFGGPGVITPASSTDASGSASIAIGGQEYSGTVTVTDTRTDELACTASDTATATPYIPLAVHLSLQAAAPSCPSMATDALSWTAVPSGGNGDYGYAWTGATCGGTSCTVNPADDDFCAGGTVQVRLSDSSGLCAAIDSEVETWTKVTTITASDL